MVGLLGGILNGLLISRFGITPILCTLGTQMFFTGVAVVLSGGRSVTIGSPDALYALGNGLVFGVPASFVIFIGVALVLGGVLRFTPYGMKLMLTGANPKAARFSGFPQARIVTHATHARLSAEFTLAPIGSIEKVLKKAGWSVGDVDLFEINEAFAVVTLAAINELKLPAEKVNVHGGACALGHPIGSSGSRIIVTLINALKQRGLKRGVASLCIGGGEATAVAIELI